MLNLSGSSSPQYDNFDILLGLDQEPMGDEPKNIFVQLDSLAKGEFNFIGEELAKKTAKETGKNILEDKKFEPIQLIPGKTDEVGSIRGREDVLNTINAIIKERKKKGEDLSGLFQIEDIDNQGNKVTYYLNPERFQLNPFTDEEYQRYYQATFNSLQELANLHKALNENFEKIEAGEQLIDPSRVKMLSREDGKAKYKESTGKEQKDAQARKAEIEKKDIEDIATAKAQQKKLQQKILEEHEVMLQAIHTSNRNKQNLENLDIKNRSIKQVNR